MGTWSITPDTGLASIDQNGLLTYQEHTSDVTYTISYSDSEGCSASKSVTIKGCTPGCDCTDLTVTGKTDISKDGGSSITIGTFSKASCMSNPRASSSTSWLSNLSVSGNDIKATVETNTGDTRNGSVTVTVDQDGGGTCDKTMSITQQAGVVPPPSSNSCVIHVDNQSTHGDFVAATLELTWSGGTITINATFLGGQTTDVTATWDGPSTITITSAQINDNIRSCAVHFSNPKKLRNGDEAFATIQASCT